MLCTTLIGRAGELAVLNRALGDVKDGFGGIVVIQGDAGVGKSRLLAEVDVVAQSLGMSRLSGRCVPSSIAVPYRPITEAFVAHFRSSSPPLTSQFDGFRGHLARFVPQWSDSERPSADQSPIIVAEAIVRLVSTIAGEAGCVLVLEDLHWSDAESIAAVEYLADAIHELPVLCVCATRPGGAASTTIDRLHRRGAATVLDVGPLDDEHTDLMIGACLASPGVPVELSRFIREHSDGNPFLVEELLAGLATSGSIRFDGQRWVTSASLAPSVPASLRDSVMTRLGSFDRRARRVIDAAALLGRRFDWDLLPGIAEVDGHDVVAALRAAVDEQLIQSDGNGFRFRHALTRDVVLGDLLPPDRRELAGRAWPAVENANPGLPGPACELAAELAEAAGEPWAAATRLLVSARRALSSSAMTSAEAIATRARMLAAGDDAIELDADELLVAILVAEGKIAAGLGLGDDIAARMERAGSGIDRRVDLLVTLARAAVSAGDPKTAAQRASAARTLVSAIDGEQRRALDARVDAVAAHAALDRAALGEAEALALRAVEAAAATGQPEVQCEAMEVLGRVTRGVRLEEATRWFQRAAEVAAAHDLPRWHLRAQQELALLAWAEGHVQPLEETRALAERYGALTTVAVMDLSLADIGLAAFDRERCMHAARACVDASVRYGLATEAVAQLWLAGACALAADEGGMRGAIASALARDPSDPRILGDLYGRVLTTYAFVSDELDDLRSLLDTMMEHVRRAPATTSIFPGRTMWAALHTIDDDDHGVEQRAELDEIARRMNMPLFTLFAEAANGVALGRAGDRRAATGKVDSALQRLSAVQVSIGVTHCHQMLFARAAHRDGWGHPERWLRESEAFFAAGGFDSTARRCRLMLASMGARVPRRGRGDAAVPPSLRALGVTSREMDVLLCVADGLSNRETAERLFLSAKTVERHISSLFDRTGVRTRGELADVARSHASLDG